MHQSNAEYSVLKKGSSRGSRAKDFLLLTLLLICVVLLFDRSKSSNGEQLVETSQTTPSERIVEKIVQLPCTQTSPSSETARTHPPIAIAPAGVSKYPNPIEESKKSRPEREAISNTCTGQVLPNGAWCLVGHKPPQYYAPGHELSVNHVPAPVPIAAEIMRVLAESEVLDLGAGLGQFGVYFEQEGRKGKYTAFDGAINVDTFTNGLVYHADLTKPLYYPADWVIFLEVGEHVPQQFQDQIIENSVKNARVGLIVSWAIPNQAGHGHVNMKTNEEVISLYEARGFKHWPEETKKLREAAKNTPSHWWFQNTILAFKRETDTPDNTWA